MRRTLLLCSLLLATMSGRAQYYPPNGFTTYTGGIINLTTASHPATAPYAGSIWSTSTIDFTQSFTMDFFASFDMASAIGGEGMAVVFGNNTTPASLNAAGMFLGYYSDPSGTFNPDFDHSIGIEIDTHNDFLYPPYVDDNSTLSDHIMIAADGQFDATHVIASPTSITGSSIKDGLYHHYTIHWNACSNLLSCDVDGKFVTGGLIPAGILLSPTNVNWGFTGSIGQDGDYSNENIRGGVVIKYSPCTRNPYCNTPCPAMSPITATGTNGTMTTPCMFHCVSSVIPGPTCFYPAIYTWSVTTPAGTITHTHVTSASSDADDLPIPYGFGGTISLTVTFTDNSGLSHFCTSAPVTRIDGCNGGIASRTEDVQQIGTDDKSIKIYPNPTDDKVTISADGNAIEHVQVFDITGKLLYEQQYNQTDNATISLGSYAPGSYIIKVNDKISRLITREK